MHVGPSVKAAGDVDDDVPCSPAGEPKRGPYSVSPKPEVCAPLLQQEPNSLLQSRQPSRTAAAVQNFLPGKPLTGPDKFDSLFGGPTPPKDMRPVGASVSLAAGGGRENWEARALGMRPVTSRMVSEPLPGNKQQNEPSVLAIKEAMGLLPQPMSPLENVLSWIESTASDQTFSSHRDFSFGDEDLSSELSKTVDIGLDDAREADSPRCEVADESTVDLPSDHETALPREPPRAPTNGPMKDGQPSGVTTTALAQRSLVLKKTNLSSLKGSSASNPLVSKEEEEWLQRQRISGVIGRMVRYIEGDTPVEDILGLRCSRRGRIMVTAVREDGRAARAGVVAGDELKSVDGWKGFQSCPANVVHANLIAPVTLIFVGFVGKLQAEVRVKRPAEPSCGLPTASDIVSAFGSARGKPQTSVQFCDEVVFQPGLSSLFIVTQRELEPGARSVRAEAGDRQGMYELHSADARNVLHRAMNSGSSSSRSSPPWPLSALPEGSRDEGAGASLPFRSSPPQHRAPSSGAACPRFLLGHGVSKNADNPCFSSGDEPSPNDPTHSV